MTAEDCSISPTHTWVFSTQVAQRKFDTIWIEQSQRIGFPHSQTNPWNPDACSISIIQISEATTDTIKYTQSVTTPSAWIPCPQDSNKIIHWNSKLLFQAHLQLKDMSWQTLTAQSYTPFRYTIADSFAVPLESLHRDLASGKFRWKAFMAYPDTHKIGKLLRSLDDGNFSKRWNIGISDIMRYLQGFPIKRNFRVKSPHPDTAWYITDNTPVGEISFSGRVQIILASYRQWTFRHFIDKKTFGGIVLAQGFDTTRARINESFTKQINQSHSPISDTDLYKYYQPGNIRAWIALPKENKSIPGWPDSIAISNFFWGYTGENRIYSWSVDSLYFPFYKSLSGQTGDGNFLFSNIHGGRGYFTGAGIDSVSFILNAAAADTMQVSALKAAWCKSIAAKLAKGEPINFQQSMVKQICIWD